MRNRARVLLAAALLCLTGLTWLVSTWPESGWSDGPEQRQERETSTRDPVERSQALEVVRSRASEESAGRSSHPRAQTDAERVSEVLIRGRLVDSRGEPPRAARAAVEVREGFERSDGPDPERPLQALTVGADGAFAFAVRARGDLSITLQIRSPMHAPRISDHLVDAFVETHDLGDLELLEGGRVAGRITDAAGNAIAGAEAVLAPSWRNPLRWSPDAAEILKPARADTAGCYELSHLMPGEYRLTARAPGMQEATVPGAVLVENEVVTKIETIPLGPGCRLAGIVLGPDDEPVGSASIRVRSADRSVSFSRRTSAGEDGRFVLEHLPAVNLDFLVRAQGFLALERPGVDPTLGEELVLRMQAGVGISGIVVDAESGAPIERYAASLVRVGSLDSPTHGLAPAQLERRIRELREQAITVQTPEERDRNEALARELEARLLEARRGASTARPRPSMHGLGPLEEHPGGRFAFDGLDEGVYAVDVAPPGHQASRSDPVEVRGGAPRPQLRIELARGISVAGVVVDTSKGIPVEGARVELSVVRDELRGSSSGASGERNPSVHEWVFAPPGPRGDAILATLTDELGRFAFHRAPPARCFLEARRAGFATRRSEPIDLREERTSLRLELPRAASVRGEVSGIPGGREREVQVLALGGHGEFRVVAVSADRSYRIEELQPGGYVLRAFLGETRPYLRRLLASLFGSASDEVALDVALADGEERVMNLSLDQPPAGAVDGVVILDGAPARGCRITLRPDPRTPASAALRSLYATADGEGRFEMRDIPFGDYILQVRGPRSSQYVHSEPVRVAPYSPVNARVDVSLGGVRGRLRASDGTPAENLEGTLWILPGCKRAPEDVRAYRRIQLVQRLRVRAGAFAESELSAGPALVIVQVQGREAVTASLDIPFRATIEVELPAGERL